MTKAIELLSLIPPKWNPRTPNQMVAEEYIGPEKEDRITINKNITTKGTLKDASRIFTEGEPTNSIPNARDDNEQERTMTINIASHMKNDGGQKKIGYSVVLSNEITISKRLAASEDDRKTKGEIYAINQWLIQDAN